MLNVGDIVDKADRDILLKFILERTSSQPHVFLNISSLYEEFSKFEKFEVDGAICSLQRDELVEQKHTRDEIRLIRACPVASFYLDTQESLAKEERRAKRHDWKRWCLAETRGWLTIVISALAIIISVIALLQSTGLIAIQEWPLWK